MKQARGIFLLTPEKEGAGMAETTDYTRRDELQRCLLGSEPDLLWPRIAAGKFSDCTLKPPARTVPLADTAPRMLLRWWVLCRVCGAQEQTFCRALGFSDKMARDLHSLTLAFLRPPQSKQALKQLLRGGLPEAPQDALPAFAMLDARWEKAADFWRQICEGNEPYCDAQLALSPGALLAWGVPLSEQQKLRALLLDAVIRAPQLNRAELLLGLAANLRRLR